MDWLHGLLGDMWERLTGLAQVAGPWGRLAVPLAALLLVIGRRYRFVSLPGIIMLIALAVYALTIRAIHLGKF